MTPARAVLGAACALGWVLAATPRVVSTAYAAETTQREVEESLTCQCGCGLTVHSCNHIQCSSGEPIKAEIAERLGRGETKEQILDVFKQRLGEKVLSSPGFNGFNVLAWIMPFFVVIAMAGVLAIGIRRRVTAIAAAAPTTDGTPSGPAADDPRRARLARELQDFDDV